MTDHTYILRVSCPDQPGIVAAVANCLQKNDCNIEDAAQFNDKDRFFMRVVLKPLSNDKPDENVKAFQKDFEILADHFDMDWTIHHINDKPKTLLLVSKQDHCLNDILYRCRTDHLGLDITGIVSNHPDCKDLADRYNLPYHHLPVDADNKAEQEAQIAKIIEDTASELIVLARYMQILSDDFSNTHAGRVINIHHSFLPGFKGAKPYHQAYARGVKLIGATAHFVTADLDEGPIIEQDVTRVDHRMTPEKMTSMGRDIEAQVLARALDHYAQRRIFMHGDRTVIL